MTKIAIVLAAVLALSAVSAAQAEYDPWIMPSDSVVSSVGTTGAGYHAFAAAELPSADPRFDDTGNAAMW
jgi:hypothetical protein